MGILPREEFYLKEVEGALAVDEAEGDAVARDERPAGDGLARQEHRGPGELHLEAGNKVPEVAVVGLLGAVLAQGLPLVPDHGRRVLGQEEREPAQQLCLLCSRCKNTSMLFRPGREAACLMPQDLQAV